MYLPKVLALAALCLCVSAIPRQSQQILEDDDCAKVLVIGCRGTMENTTYGALKYVVDGILDQIEGSDAQGVEYPSAGIKLKPPPQEGYDYSYADYIKSEIQGHAEMLKILHSYGGKCPKTIFALLGYSQGAHVVGDVLCGKASPLRNPLEPQIAEKVKAIMQYGDPSNWKDLAWHVGSSTKKGLLPRQSFDACKEYGDKWVSYCTAKDPFCAPELIPKNNNVTVHLHYADPDVYGDAAIKFVVDKLKAALKEEEAKMELK